MDNSFFQGFDKVAARILPKSVLKGLAESKSPTLRALGKPVTSGGLDKLLLGGAAIAGGGILLGDRAAGVQADFDESKVDAVEKLYRQSKYYKNKAKLIGNQIKPSLLATESKQVDDLNRMARQQLALTNKEIFQNSTQKTLNRDSRLEFVSKAIKNKE